jgi:ABC-2 type transport system permease protein
VGSEFGSRNLGEWLEAAGGDPLTALVGKLVPYFGIFVLLMVVAGLTIHRGYEVPFRGSAVLTGAAGCLLVVAYLSLGALLQLLARNLAFGLSLTGIVCSPAFGFAGVGFPILAMGGFAQVWGSFLPLRWYIQILFDQAARGVPPVDSLEPFAALAALALAYFGLAVLRLRSTARHGPASPAPLSRNMAASCATGAPSVCLCWRPSSMACSTLSPISDSWFVPYRSPSSTATHRS